MLSTLNFLKKNKILNYNYKFKKRKFISNINKKTYTLLVKNLKFLRNNGLLCNRTLIQYNYV